MDAQPAIGPEEDLESLLAFVRDSRGFDLTGYKRSTLIRRVHKRMMSVEAANLADYQDLLETSAEEFEQLFNTILINVTGFFRDPEAWTYLQREIMPDLLADISADDEIRVWSAGCSSGEEAYSLAMTFVEALGVDEYLKRVKIYGTDVDEEALHEARVGTYTARSLEPLSDQLREKYFEPVNARFSFRPDLRRRVIFGRHDITRDAPISRLNLLTCRNTLMYFNVEAQNQIVDRFHFALREDGHLFLGKAEMLLSDSDRFEVANMRQRIFRRRPGEARRPHQALPITLEMSTAAEMRDVARRRLLRDLVLDGAPGAVLAIDLDGNLEMVNAQARAQFGLTPHDVGRPFRDLEVSYRPVELRSLIELAHAERRTIRITAERRVSTDEVQYFDVTVQPLWGSDGLAVGAAVSFVDVTAVTRLQREIKRNREELETAYEELQSTNEELETMNEELRIRGTELGEVRAYLEGVLASIAAGVVVMDGELRVGSWNRGAEELWGLRAEEVSQQEFFALDFGLPTEELREPLAECVTLARQTGPVKVDAVNRKGRSISCTITCSPLDGRGGGVVILMEQTEPGRTR